MGRGAAGLDLGDASGRLRLDPLSVTARDVTGAGDALAAATLFASLCGLKLPAAARIGRLAATLAIVGKTAFGIADLREAALRFDSGCHADLARLHP
jgi:sugar/nucleoside kinase (ribokinase family)